MRNVIILIIAAMLFSCANSRCATDDVFPTEITVEEINDLHCLINRALSKSSLQALYLGSVNDRAAGAIRDLTVINDHNYIWNVTRTGDRGEDLELLATIQVTDKDSKNAEGIPVKLKLPSGKSAHLLVHGRVVGIELKVHGLLNSAVLGAGHAP